MQIILLERVGKLGAMGDTVTVKDGYARNYLLPKGFAIKANEWFDGIPDQERLQVIMLIFGIL